MVLAIQYSDELSELISGFGFTEIELARSLGATPRTVRRWMAGATPTAASRARIEDLYGLLQLLRRSVSTESIPKWARRRVESLDGSRPADLLVDGKIDPLLRLAEGLAYGAFA